MQKFFVSLYAYPSDLSSLFFLQVLPVLFFATYVLRGLCLTFLCRAAGRRAVWMAWVPFANRYLLGLMADIYTDDRVRRGEIGSYYAPSTLRRPMLGYSVASGIFGVIAGVGVVFLSVWSFLGLLMSAIYESTAGMLYFIAIFLLISCVITGLFVLFYVLYQVATYKAHYRLFFMLGASDPALCSATVIFMPVLSAAMLLVFTVKNRRVLTEKFFPPMENPRTEDGEMPPLS